MNKTLTSTTVTKTNPNLLVSSVVCLAAYVFFLYEFMLQVSPNVMTFELMRDYHVDAAGLGIISGAFYIAYTLMQVPAGLCYDRFGPRFLLCAATTICAVGALAFGLTESAFAASAGRFLMGFGSAFSFVGCLVLVARWFPPKYFAVFAGILQMMGSVGALIGEAPLAIAVDTFGWRETILFLGFLGLGVAAFIWLVVRDSPTSAPVILPQYEQKSELRRLVQVCKSRENWMVAIYAFTSWAPIVVFPALWGVPFLMTRYGIDATTAAQACSMIWVSIGIGSPLVGWWSDKIGLRCKPLNVCSIIGLISFSLVLFAPGLPFWSMFPLLFIFGFSASAQTLSFALVKDNNRPRMVGTAIGFNNMAVVSGGILFQPLVGLILDLGWNGVMDGDMRVYSVGDYRLALTIIPICFLVGYIISKFYLKESHCEPVYTE